MTDLCPHDGDPNSCPPCVNAHHPRLDLGPNIVHGHRFLARYDGHCTGCNLTIHRGQAVQFVTIDGTGHTMHDGCTP